MLLADKEILMAAVIDYTPKGRQVILTRPIIRNGKPSIPVGTIGTALRGVITTLGPFLSVEFSLNGKIEEIDVEFPDKIRYYSGVSPISSGKRRAKRR